MRRTSKVEVCQRYFALQLEQKQIKTAHIGTQIDAIDSENLCRCCKFNKRIIQKLKKKLMTDHPEILVYLYLNKSI